MSGSHDLEDVVTVIDGRAEIITEMAMVMANCLFSRPWIPLMNPTGMNTDARISAMLTTGSPNNEMHLYGNGRHPGDALPDGSRMTGGLTDRSGIGSLV